MPKSTKDLAYSEQHVLERALERYSLQLDADDYRAINEAVQRARNGGWTANTRADAIDEEFGVPLNVGLGAATLLNDEGGDEQIWSVGWGQQSVICVWSTSPGRVTTLLPEGTVVTRRKGAKPRKAKK